MAYSVFIRGGSGSLLFFLNPRSVQTRGALVLFQPIQPGGIVFSEPTDVRLLCSPPVLLLGIGRGRVPFGLIFNCVVPVFSLICPCRSPRLHDPGYDPPHFTPSFFHPVFASSHLPRPGDRSVPTCTLL